MHKVEDDHLITPHLLRKFIEIAEDEGNNGQHYAMIQKADRSWLAHNPHSPEIDEMQMIFARDVVGMLNKELHHDGVWCIVFTAPGALAHLLQSRSEYSRFTLVWLDKDGDVQIQFEWVAGESDELDFADCIESGLESWVERAEMAWQQWFMLSRMVLDAQPDETYKAAQGERPPSERN